MFKRSCRALKARARQPEGLHIVAGFGFHHVFVRVSGVGDVHRTEDFPIHRRAAKHGFAIAHTPQTQQRQQGEKRGRKQDEACDPQEY
jgi:hypothetical protein